MQYKIIENGVLYAMPLLSFLCFNLFYFYFVILLLGIYRIKYLICDDFTEIWKTRKLKKSPECRAQLQRFSMLMH